jgi:hypothetical protein
MEQINKSWTTSSRKENNGFSEWTVEIGGCIRWKRTNFCKSENANLDRRIMYKRTDLLSCPTLTILQNEPCNALPFSPLLWFLSLSLFPILTTPSRMVNRGGVDSKTSALLLSPCCLIWRRLEHTAYFFCYHFSQAVIDLMNSLQIWKELWLCFLLKDAVYFRSEMFILLRQICPEIFILCRFEIYLKTGTWFGQIGSGSSTVSFFLANFSVATRISTLYWANDLVEHEIC